ncbi:nitrate reductase subunit alpha [Mycolicibacterium brumae]|uniref:nitrate reductase (quinone) n=1 Tax=Mycolicibacterium brumae TaxID=85968 RepID=A0A2G5PDG3_9MYCO|nr:nitrate reductase subunit alpha [Mycolicibacterium brumae]MCV7193477.1 nitrate reductase subunit alpha [Mycolicibacterium brumae]PIB76063.1 nitrate reductase subunit alpha [Mycolicibacterium brumae]RWA17176.1 nitrate reductase A subunit alpha [Mycolicibacterium brumae DSM 44177]UWW09250.1 nitrate reductase subunit alpha [Mycolicibacterium brumae]
MTRGNGAEVGPATDGPLADALLSMGRFLRPGTVSEDLRTVYLEGGRAGDAFYRDRWSHDKVVRSTHGVNCTGSCSWKVYVKDGIITWETQQTDYPSVGPDSPEYEPRGCPRGAAFSWYTYSPTRVRYPYIRDVLARLWRDAKETHPDPVDAWAAIVEDPAKATQYKRARGKGGLIRTSWDEALEIAAAAHVHTLVKYGPDRIAGFSPIPAMSMVSHGAGARFLNLIGGTMLSFYDWYADLPVASPQVFGDQTDVPESADWWNAGYLIMWGSNVPVTRTPDAHFMAEARYRGQKVVTVSPDYTDNTKFADEWVAPHPGTDAAVALAMGHVILREHFVDTRTPAFEDYQRRFTDAPFLVALEPHGDALVPGKFLTASDLDGAAAQQGNAEFKPVLLDADGTPVVPNGSLGHRFSAEDEGRWNLDLGDICPPLSIADLADWDGQTAEIALPRFDLDPAPGQEHAGGSGVVRRGVPVRAVAGRKVTTVFDLMLAQYGVGRDGLPGHWPTGYDDDSTPGTPSWQQRHTSVPAAQVTRIAREFADNAVRSGGRSMILMGAGTNHWFHSDTIYRTFLALTTLTGCQGRNGGGWAHYVGQEKVRPVTGYQQYAAAADWNRPPRFNIGTAFWYIATDQWRYDGLPADALASPLSRDVFAGRTTADCLVESVKRGWMPSYPTFNRNPLALCDEADVLGKDPAQHVVDSLNDGSLRYAVEDPDATENFPRIALIWRANILGSSGKGNEYFLKHLLGADSAVRAAETSEGSRPSSIRWREQAPEGKLDLLLTADFRMTSTTLFSDLVMPAATWYEKHDLSSTDMHPFVHSFNPAINPPWQTKTDYEMFGLLAERFSEYARGHLGVRRDLVATPLQHDTPDVLATPHGRVVDAPLKPGVTMPKLVVVERDYPMLAERWKTLGPLIGKLGLVTKGVKYSYEPELKRLAGLNGTVAAGPYAGSVRLDTDQRVCEVILALSGTTNGRVAVAGFRELERQTGQELAFLAADHAGSHITFSDVSIQPRSVITSPEWSGSEHGGRRYTAFAVNVEHLKPWHTLTGRQHFYLDHDWMSELGENLPTYRPPLDMHRLFGDEILGATTSTDVSVRYLTPHSKWSIHSEYQDNLFMLSLSRGGPVIWMSPQDAAKIGVRDNEWIEAVNRNGVVVARANVSHRMPEGTVYMYHATDRTVDVPIAEASGLRGGIHNSLTRILLKPSHLIGGYAQLAWAFNYLGPTGNQRDEVTTIRRRSQEVAYR